MHKYREARSQEAMTAFVKGGYKEKEFEEIPFYPDGLVE